jgi:hypothetical protein
MKEGPKRDHFTDISNIYGKVHERIPQKKRDKEWKKILYGICDIKYGFSFTTTCLGSWHNMYAQALRELM